MAIGDSCDYPDREAKQLKLVSFEMNGANAYGAVIDDRVVRLDTLPGAAIDLKSAIAARDNTPWSMLPTQTDIALDSVKLLPVIPNPGKIICVATNFREWTSDERVDPEYPLVFTRFAESMTGHGQPLIKPAVTQKFDFEGELAVIIGKSGHKIPHERAMEHVAGYSCLNDGSVRDWQRHSTQFTPGKNFYRSGSIGPWLVTVDEVPDVAALTLQTRVNGVVKQEIALARMIFDIPWLIAYFSSFTPLAPGDVIATGTPSGFGSSRMPPEFLKAGDIIEIEITGVGTLKNAVLGE